MGARRAALTEVPRHRFIDLAILPVSLRLGRFSAQLLSWGFFRPRWWRNYLHMHSFFEICYAYQVHLSERRLSRVFLKTMNVSMMDYLTSIRMQTAAHDDERERMSCKARSGERQARPGGGSIRARRFFPGPSIIPRDLIQRVIPHMDAVINQRYETGIEPLCRTWKPGGDPKICPVIYQANGD